MKKKSNALFYGFLAVLVAGFCFYYCYKNLMPSYQESNNKISSLEEETRAIIEKASSLNKVKSDMNLLGDVVDKMFLAVPEGVDEPNLYTELEAILLQQKFKNFSFQVSEVGDGPASAVAKTSALSKSSSVQTVSVSFSVNGSFEQFSKTIEALEKDIRFMDIRSLNIAKTDTGMSMSIQLNALAKPEATEKNKSVNTTTP